jgi:hypothetical protein
LKNESLKDLPERKYKNATFEPEVNLEIMPLRVELR